MDKLWLLLVFVTNLLPHGACLQEDVGFSEEQQQGFNLEVMAASIRQLKELTDKLDKRLDTVERLEKRLKDQEKNIQTLTKKLDKKLEPILKMENKLKLLEKLEERLEEHDKILQEQSLSLEMDDQKLQVREMTCHQN